MRTSCSTSCSPVASVSAFPRGWLAGRLPKAFGLEETLVLQRLMGGFEPSAASFKALSGPPSEAESQASGRPYTRFFWPVRLIPIRWKKALRSSGGLNGSGMASGASWCDVMKSSACGAAARS